MVDDIWWTVWTTIYELFTLFILFLWIVVWFIHFVGIIHGVHRLHRRNLSTQNGSEEKGESVPGVTVIKPLVGNPMDPNLMTNLETYFHLAYPKYEVRFCVADEGDPCIMVVKQLMSKYPSVHATLHVGASNVGVNPKINNMYKAYQNARYPLLLISDAGIFMKPEALPEMVSLMTGDVGIVHQVPYTTDRKGWPATLEKVFFGTYHARMYLFLNFLDIIGLKANCLTGMSALIRKKIFDQRGGMSEWGQYLAEDYFFAMYAQQNGWKIRLSSYPALQNHGIYSTRALIARIVRWTKLRVKMSPATIIFEPITECVVLGLLSALAATRYFQVDYLAFFLFHMLAWILFDWTMINIVQNGPLSFSKFEFAITWLFREFCVFPIYLSSYQDPYIYWRTKKFKVQWGGVTVAVPKLSNKTDTTEDEDTAKLLPAVSNV